jgi:hypothetical protein
MMSGTIGVESREEHEDVSATYQFHFARDTRGMLAEEGLKLIIYCAAAQMDLQKVYDFIEENMGLTEYKFGENDD